jgi:hypothetical protein
MRVRWFVVLAVASLLVGTVVGWAFLRDDDASHEAAAAPTTTSTVPPTTTTTIALVPTATLRDALQSASHRLTGQGASTEDLSAFTAQYHQDQRAGTATDPASAAEAYVRLHHPAEVTAWGYVRQAKCFGERLLPGGTNPDCDTTTTARR